MTVYKQGRRKTFLYDFQYEGRRYRGNTKQTTKVDAERVEAKLKEKLRHAAGGILVRTREDSPRFQDWAEVFYAYKAARLAAPQAISDLIPVLLRFWGARPAAHAIDGEPYHDLRLCDPVTDPSWILQFEAWMVARGIGA